MFRLISTKWTKTTYFSQSMFHRGSHLCNHIQRCHHQCPYSYLHFGTETIHTVLLKEEKFMMNMDIIMVNMENTVMNVETLKVEAVKISFTFNTTIWSFPPISACARVAEGNHCTCRAIFTRCTVARTYG